MDEQLAIVRGRQPDEFEALVNEYLNGGRWRVVATEMSVTDHHYWAMLVRAAEPEKRGTIS